MNPLYSKDGNRLGRLHSIEFTMSASFSHSEIEAQPSTAGEYWQTTIFNLHQSVLITVFAARPLSDCLLRGPLLVLLGFLPLWAFGQDRLFQKAELSDFPRANVQSILQDEAGFLWIATSDGLGKYDGHQLIEYRYLPHDTTSICNNYITNLSQDNAGNILIGTHNGIGIYLQDEDRFLRLSGNGEHLSPGTSDIVHHIMQDRRGWYWYGTYQGLFRRKSLTAPIEYILPNEELAENIPYKTIWKIHEDQAGRLWFGSGTGLIVTDSSATKFEVFSKDKAGEHGLDAIQTWDFIELADGTLFIGSESGVFKAEERGDSWYFHPYQREQMSHPFVNCMFNDGDSIMWIGTFRGGINEFDLQTETVRVHRHQPEQTHSVALDQIQALYKDRTRMLWVGAGGQLQFTTGQLNNFQTISTTADNPQSLSNDIIKSVFFDHADNLWIGTYDGLNRLDSAQWVQKDLAFTTYSSTGFGKNKISHSNIFGLHEDSQQLLWACTWKGLNYLDLRQPLDQATFQAITYADGLPHNIIHEIKEIQPGQYWVATYGKLARMYFDRELPREVRFDWFNHGEPGEGNLVNATVYTMAKDRHDRWWFGTYDGLSQHRLRDGQDFFENYQHLASDSTSLSNNSIRCLYLDSKGRFWIGTRTGLNLVIQNRPTDRARFQHFGIREGFPNDVIHFIEEDERGMLWIGTNAGLLHFNPDKAVLGEPAIEKVYTEAEGLAASSFVFRSSYQRENGQIFVGTADGLNYFHPQDLTINQHPPQVAITQIKINNETLRPSQVGDAILTVPIQQTQRIDLRHWQNQLEFSFSAMDFLAPSKNTYAYRLRGLHDNWLGDEGTFRAQYTQLPPGDYIFEVRGANSDGVWSNETRALQIRIRPPFWRTNLAYIFYLLGLALALWRVTQNSIKRRTQALAQQFAIENARQEERVRLRQKNAADFHDELGHRLTKISLFLELAKRNIRQPQELFAHFQKIKQHVDGLSSGMRDLIWALDPAKDNLLQTMMRLHDFGDQLFEATPTQFKVEGLAPVLERIQLQPDVRQQLLLLFKEAMHNCLKYAQASEARLQIVINDQHFSVSFQDNGRGFHEEELSKAGYGLRNMKDRAEKMDAHLIIESSTATGTRIALEEIPHMG